jgi:hypothetical protein
MSSHSNRSSGRRRGPPLTADEIEERRLRRNEKQNRYYRRQVNRDGSGHAMPILIAPFPFTEVELEYLQFLTDRKFQSRDAIGAAAAEVISESARDHFAGRPGAHCCPRCKHRW